MNAFSNDVPCVNVGRSGLAWSVDEIFGKPIKIGLPCKTEIFYGFMAHKLQQTI